MKWLQRANEKIVVFAFVAAPVLSARRGNRQHAEGTPAAGRHSRFGRCGPGLRVEGRGVGRGGVGG